MKPGVLALIIVVAAGPAYAQSGNEGSIEGIVTDQTGAVIVGAVVAARHVETSADFHTTTDERGTFRFVVLPVGPYEISAAHTGFVKFVQQGVHVTVGARVSLTIQLRVGTREESVLVTREAPLVEPTRTSLTSVVDQRSIASVPLNGRNFLNFILLTPGMATTGGNGLFSVAGQSPMNTLFVDGADHSSFGADPVGSAAPNRYLFSQESIQEFQVSRGPYSAEFGRTGTAVVNVITKSGTNDAHGSVFWYYRDRDLNAIGPIEKMKGQPKEPFHSNQFGGALGGPIRRDRLFFYGSYDGQRRNDLLSTTLNLPSNFTVSADPETAGFQQRALEYLQARSAPYLQEFRQDVTLTKLDWRGGDKHLLRGSWNRHRYTHSNAAVFGPQHSLEHTGPNQQIADTLTVSLTSVLNGRSVNVARFSYVGNHDPKGTNSYLPEASVSEGQQVLLVGRLPNLPVDNGVWRGEWSDTLSLNRRRHALKFGGNLIVERARFFSALNFYGSYQFSSLERFGRSLAGQPGRADRFTQAFSAAGTPPIDVHPDSIEPAVFVQETWRLHPSMTLDIGLRYEAQIMRQSNVRNPSPALEVAGVDTTYIPTDSNNVAPRFGLAWNPMQSQRIIVRGGYGLYFPRFLPATAARAFFQNGITTQTRTFTGRDVPAYPNTICSPPDPSGAPPACRTPVAGNDTIMAIPRTYQQSVLRQASLGVEYAPASDVTLSITYLRVKGDHLIHWQDINLFDPDSAPIGIVGTDTVLTYRRYRSERPVAGFERILLLETNGYSSYHGATLELKKRFSHGFQVASSYTFGKAIDDKPNLGALNPGPGDGGLLSDALAPHLDRGVSANSQLHSFVLSGVWYVPYAKNLRQPMRAVLSGWELGGIVTAYSGDRYSGMLNFDLNNDGNKATDRTPGLARNTYSLPAVVSVDPRLTRKVRIRDRLAMHVSVDSFNLLNRANISGVQTTQYSVKTSPKDCGTTGTPCLVPQVNFGTPTSAALPRMMQLSVRLIF